MRVAIFGFTEFGEYIKDLLLYQHTIEMHTVCFVDNDKSKQGQKHEGVQVINADELQKRYKRDIDIVIIGVLGVHRSLFPIIMQLKKMEIKDVYFVPNHHFYYKRKFDESRDFLLENCVYCGDLDKPILPYLEMHVSDHCNLNCKACSHFSPLFSGGGGGFSKHCSLRERFKKDERIVCITADASIIRGRAVVKSGIGTIYKDCS